MIDPNEAIRAFKEKFGKMSYSEREKYLKEMGFSFGERGRAKKTNGARRNYRSGVARAGNSQYESAVKFVLKRRNLEKSMEMRAKN